MDRITSRPVVVGKIARAEICPCASSVVLSLGGLSLRLERMAAEDVAMTLMQALAYLGCREPPDAGSVGPVDSNAGGTSDPSEESN